MKLFKNAKIRNDNIYYDSFVLDNDRIFAIDFYSNLKDKYIYDEIIDLNHHVVLPSFIDGHSHLISVCMSLLEVDLSLSKSVDEICQTIAQYIKNNNIQPDEFIICNGYDHNELIEKRHPFDYELNAFKNPICLKHKSNHFGVFNHPAQKVLNIDTDKGYLEETAFVDASKKLPMPNFEKIRKCFVKAQELYLKNGITILQEGMVVNQMIPLYQGLLVQKALFLNCFAYADITSYDKAKASLEPLSTLFKIDGLKIILDGSPQGQTAWISKPYLNSSKCGNNLMSDQEVKNAISLAIKHQTSLLAHANGDMAIKQMIRCVKSFKKDQLAKAKIVLIHAQLMDVNDLNDLKNLGIMVSYFVNHIYHFSNIHIANLGARGYDISPLKSTYQKGINFSLHQDSPVVEMNMFEAIYCAVCRINKEGVHLNEDECISLETAIKACTLYPAIQYGIEKDYGTFEVNKKADFIVIDKDIYEIETRDIKDIKVLETYKSGVRIYSL